MAKEKGYTKRVESSGSVTAEKTIQVSDVESDLLFGKKNYIFILSGIGLIFLGMILMSGGHMPSPDVWDESLIYSPIRITVAPILILAGLIVNVYAVFVKK
jgi:Protein of unknown function (DUF3098)